MRLSATRFILALTFVSYASILHAEQEPADQEIDDLTHALPARQ